MLGVQAVLRFPQVTVPGDEMRVFVEGARVVPGAGTHQNGHETEQGDGRGGDDAFAPGWDDLHKLTHCAKGRGSRGGYNLLLSDSGLDTPGSLTELKETRAAIGEPNA